MDRLQKQQITVPLSVDETLEWCISFVLDPKPNGKVQFCLDLATLNKVLIRPVHRGPTLNVLLNMAYVKHLTLITASSDYHNLKLDKK